MLAWNGIYIFQTDDLDHQCIMIKLFLHLITASATLLLTIFFALAFSWKLHNTFLGYSNLYILGINPYTLISTNSKLWYWMGEHLENNTLRFSIIRCYIFICRHLPPVKVVLLTHFKHRFTYILLSSSCFHTR